MHNIRNLSSLLQEIKQKHPKIKSSRNPRVLQAMRVIDRKNFLPDDKHSKAYIDEIVNIGYGATCSQPSLVAAMIDVLDLKNGQKVLEIGTGSGYHAALVYQLIRNGGELTTMEIVPELAEMGRSNLERQFDKGARIKVLEENGRYGVPGETFDRIYFTAAAALDSFRMPQEIIDTAKAVLEKKSAELSPLGRKYLHDMIATHESPKLRELYDLNPLLEQLNKGGKLLIPDDLGKLNLYEKDEEQVKREILGVGYIFVRLQ